MAFTLKEFSVPYPRTSYCTPEPYVDTLSHAVPSEPQGLVPSPWGSEGELAHSFVTVHGAAMLQRPYRTYGASSRRRADEEASKAFDLAMKEDREPPRSPVASNGLDQSKTKRRLSADQDIEIKSKSVQRDRHHSRKRQAPERRQSAAKASKTKTPKRNWRVCSLECDKQTNN